MPPTCPDPFWTPLALADVAQLCGVQKDTVIKWRKRALRGEPFPLPRWHVSDCRTPLWAHGEVAAWLAAR